METKECSFSGFKMNGFLALFLHLVVLTAWESESLPR